MAEACVSHVVDSAKGLGKVTSKGPNAVVVVPELADEDSPDGWQVMGLSRVRVVAPVRQFVEHALYDLAHGIPEEYRNMPEVEEQREQLRRLLDGRAWPFTVELRDSPVPDPEGPSSLEHGRFADSEDGQGSYFLDADDPRCRRLPSIEQQLGLLEDAEPEPSGAVELGTAQELRRCVIAPGNGCDCIRECNWYGWLHDRLVADALFDAVLCEDFPDPYDAKRSVWIPFLRDELRVGPDTILVGHSSGAEAAMRLAEETPVGGLVLVSACHSDQGDAGERASGYYPPSGGAWNWEAIRKNTGWIVQFHSRDDKLVPVEEARVVAAELRSEYHELDGHSHFFEPFRELVGVIHAKAKP